MNESWLIKMNDGRLYHGNTLKHSGSSQNDDTRRLVREDGVFTMYRNGALEHTWSETSTNTVRLALASGGSSSGSVWTDLSWRYTDRGNAFASMNVGSANQVSVGDPVNLDVTTTSASASQWTGASTFTYGSGTLSSSGNDYGVRSVEEFAGDVRLEFLLGRRIRTR